MEHLTLDGDLTAAFFSVAVALLRFLSTTGDFKTGKAF